MKLLLYHQKDFADRNGIKASDFARQVNSPEIWRLFPEDITEDEIVQLKRAHTAVCTCGGKSKDITEAAENVCLWCYKKYVEEDRDHDSSTTLLMEAAERGHLEIAKILICKEAKARDSDGFTAFYWPHRTPAQRL